MEVVCLDSTAAKTAALKATDCATHLSPKDFHDQLIASDVLGGDLTQCTRRIRDTDRKIRNSERSHSLLRSENTKGSTSRTRTVFSLSNRLAVSEWMRTIIHHHLFEVLRKHTKLYHSFFKISVMFLGIRALCG